MAKIDSAKLWSLNYRLVANVLADVSAEVAALGLEVKELFVLSEMDEHPYPAELAGSLCIPKPTVTAYLKRLESAGLVRREIDAADLRRHRLGLTAAGRKVLGHGMELLSSAFGARLGRLTGAEQGELRRLFEKLSDD
ncbi:MAG: MarR family transcriptional regulator [Polyangiales bacterium]